jgi:hypothetical protein
MQQKAVPTADAGERLFFWIHIQDLTGKIHTHEQTYGKKPIIVIFKRLLFCSVNFPG